MKKKSKKYPYFTKIFYLFFLLSFSLPCQETEEIIEDQVIKTNISVININEEINNETEQSKCCSFPTIRNLGYRICKSDNRSLGTLFGCIAGGIVATVLVATGSSISLQIFGDNASLPYKIGGILLSVGVGGNLSSYIGGSIDIITGDKTIFDAIGSCYGSSKIANKEDNSREIEPN